MGHESSASARRRDTPTWALIGLTALSGVGAYQAASTRLLGFGFPLDDSWIHVTYARNLATAGEWAFRIGQPSAGSTAPLWSLLLVPGVLLGLAPLWWSYLLGYLSLIGLGIVAEWVVRHLNEEYRPRLPWVGMFVVLEWHMLWAASSGMETILHALLATIILGMLMTGRVSFAALGLLVGLSVWVRPDGITLAAPAMIGAVLVSGGSTRSRMAAFTSFVLGFAALFVPYMVFNLWLSGTPMPNTFYAKQAEYAAWQGQPLFYRLGIGLAQISTGPFVLLWPGLAASVIGVLRTRNIAMGSALAWALGYVVMYLLRLPAYQHGRYLMPAMPILFVLGLIGYMELRKALLGMNRGWAIALAWQWALILLAVGFAVLGARAYARDVALIESEMVTTARWIADNVPSEAVVAAHDIGALGYFDGHELIDLAGLVSPEVIPFLRNEVALAAFLDRRGVEYLIAFPDFYPELAAKARLIHSTGAPFAPAGLGNMSVYCWRCP